MVCVDLIGVVLPLLCFVSVLWFVLLCYVIVCPYMLGYWMLCSVLWCFVCVVRVDVLCLVCVVSFSWCVWCRCVVCVVGCCCFVYGGVSWCEVVWS